MLISKKILLAVIILAAIGIVGFAFYQFRQHRSLKLPKVKRLKVPHFSIQPDDSHFLGTFISKQKGVSIVLFFRYGCHYSRGFLPTFQKLAQQGETLGVFFGAVEANNDPNIRSQEKKQISKELELDIITFPYVVIFKDGHVMHVMQGDENARTEANIKRILEKVKNTPATK